MHIMYSLVVKLRRPFACSHQFLFTFAFTLEKPTVCFLSDILHLDLNFLYKWGKKKSMHWDTNPLLSFATHIYDVLLPPT